MLRNVASGRIGTTEARPSPNKYNTQQNNNSISQQKYKNETTVTIRNNSLSPQKSSAVQQHNLSSLILMPSPIKFAPQDTKFANEVQQSDISVLDRTSPQFVALHLASNVFMNSTTRFMKGFGGSPKGSPANSKEKNTNKQAQITKRMESKIGASSVRKNKTPQKNALQMTASKYMQSTTKYVKPVEEQLVYPSKQKIEKIIKGELSTARSSQKRLSGAVQQTTVNRNRFKSQVSGNRGNISSASKSHSNSSSVRKLARRKEKQRELKFMEKKKDGEQVISSQVQQKGVQVQIKISTPQSKVQKSAPIQRQGLNNIRSAQNFNRNVESSKIQQSNIASSKPISRNDNKVTQAKSAQPKSIVQKQQTSKPFSRQPQNARQPLVKPVEEQRQEKKINQNLKQKVIPSIIQPNLDSKIQKKDEYRSLKTLPSGELPLQTPIKPARIQSSKLILETKEQAKPIQRGKVPQPPQISSIKEENSSEMNNNSKNIVTKKTSYYGYNKQQASTHIDVQPTQPLVYQGAQSKMSKNQSTKIGGPNENFQRIWGGGSTLTKIINNHNTNTNKVSKIQEKVEETVTPIEPKKTIARKTEKAIPVKESISQTKISLNPSIIIDDNEKKTVNRNQVSYLNKKQKEPIEISSQTSLQQTVNAKKNNNIRSPEPTKPSTRQIVSPASKNQHKGFFPAQSSKIIPPVTVSAGNLPTKTSQQSLVQRISPSSKIQVIKKEDNPVIQQANIKMISKKQSLKEEGNKQLQVNQYKKQENSQKQLEKEVLFSVKRIVGPLLQTAIKIYRKKLLLGFYEIHNFSKHTKAHQQQALILGQAAADIQRGLIKNNYRVVFDQFKRLLLANQNTKKPSLTPTSGRQFASGIIFRLLSSKQRSYFDAIKRFSFLQKQVPIITNKQTKSNNKDTIALQSVLLSQFIRILTSYHQSKAKIAFSKIVLEAISKKKQQKSISNQQINQLMSNSRSPPKNVKPPRDYQTQKKVLYENRDSLNDDLSRLQYKISDKKKYATTQKAKLLKKQDDLNKKNHNLQKQVSQKRNKNKELKNNVEQSQSSQDLDISLPEFQPLVGILTEIYSTVFKSTEGVIDVEKLVTKYKLSREDHSPILDQWASLTENLRLKREIGRWQGQQQLHRSKSILLKQQQIASKVLKNYVRQRYLWQWVKIAAQKL